VYNLIRSLLFFFDAEAVHYFAMKRLMFFSTRPFWRKIVLYAFYPKNEPVRIDNWQLTFKNPIGLGAGFDKNAVYLPALYCLGFGYVEIGTVTPLPQDGNEKPRLFRLPKDRALINRMGFNNLGIDQIVENLKTWRKIEPAYRKGKLIIGGNIGKNKSTPNEEAWKDYEICFRKLYPFVDYFVVNVSSPNTPGLRALQEKDALKEIFVKLHTLRKLESESKPILLKIAPDLLPDDIDDILKVHEEIKLDGLVISNTTISRGNLLTPKKKVDKIGPGGLSGLPLKTASTQLINYVHSQTKGLLPIIGSGGIFNKVDVAEKKIAGASLVQVWTGFIYEGPAIVKKLLRK